MSTISPPASAQLSLPATASVVRWSDGSTYEGTMEGTERHGQGRYVDESGNVYEGRWVHDKKEGYFQCVFRNHETFNGMFVNDRRHGRGVHTFADGSKYDGEYENDVRHGKGLLYTMHEFYSVHKIFVRFYERGTLKEEHELQQGVPLLTNKSGYGFGTTIDENGERYDGDHEDYLRHGKGMVTSVNGDVYNGEWERNEKHGVGMRRTLDGRFFFQYWDHGQLTREVESDYLNWKNSFWYDEGGFASHN